MLFMHEKNQFCPEYFQFMKKLLTCNHAYINKAVQEKMVSRGTPGSGEQGVQGEVVSEGEGSEQVEVVSRGGGKGEGVSRGRW